MYLQKNIINDRVNILWVGCDDTIGVWTTWVDPTITVESLVVSRSVVGWYDPDDELIPLLGSDKLAVIAVDIGEWRACNNSIEEKKNNNAALKIQIII